MIFSKLSIAIIITLALTFGATTSNAYPITFGFHTEDATGYFTFESTTTDSDPDPEYGFYFDSVTAATIFSQGYTFDLDPLGSSFIGVQHIYEAAFDEHYNQAYYGWDIAPIAGLPDLYVEFYYEQFAIPPSYPQLVYNDSLPLTQLDASLQEGGFAGILPRNGEDCDGGRYCIEFNPVPQFYRVPEPSIIALFAVGLFGVGFARRKKQSGIPKIN